MLVLMMVFFLGNLCFCLGFGTFGFAGIFFFFNSCSVIPDLMANTIAFASEMFCLMGKDSHVKLRVPTPIKWKPLDSGWAKLNTDGASLGNPGIAGGGGLIRDSDGGWVGGFARAIGYTTSVQAELRALKDGLMLAIDLGILYLAIEMDSLVAIDFVNSKTIPNVFFLVLLWVIAGPSQRG